MANEEQLSILKQGVDVWSEWRVKNRYVPIDLRGGNLSNINLRGADLPSADLREADLSNTDLIGANLLGASLIGANLLRAYLREAILYKANLNKAILYTASFYATNIIKADLSETDLRDASLKRTFLIQTNLHKANLSGANLREANLNGADLSETRLSFAQMGDTFLGNVDLSAAIGMDDVEHGGPSSIGTNTLEKSKGQIPDIFLRGCGLSDWEIEMAKLYNPDLHNNEFIDIQNKIFDLRQHQAIQITPLFISYNHNDSTFVDKVGKKFTEKGIRYWRDIHDLKAGKIEKQIDSAISQGRTVLLVLSENSLASDWVEHEVITARNLEKSIGRDLLCPVALDDSWNDSKWEKRLMEQVKKYNILDFSEWEDDVKFEGMFHKLMDGLELFYKG